MIFPPSPVGIGRKGIAGNRNYIAGVNLLALLSGPNYSYIRKGYTHGCRESGYIQIRRTAFRRNDEGPYFYAQG
jgi:hypothetical protein